MTTTMTRICSALRWSILLLALAVLAACTSQATRRANSDALYQQIEQQAGSTARLVHAIFDRVYADPRIVALFEKTDRADLERLVTEQICFEAGGPCNYSGRTMEESHAGFGLTHKDFDAFVEDFILGMEDSGIRYRTQNQLLRIFAPMRADIIDK